MSDVTRILSQIDSGDPSAAEQLLPLVYDELRKLAAAKLAHEKPGQTLQATALVHEVYLRLVGEGKGTGDRKQGTEVGSQSSEDRSQELGDQELSTVPCLQFPGIPAAISLPQQPRPCGGSWWIAPAASKASKEAGDYSDSTWTAWKSPSLKFLKTCSLWMKP